MYSMCMRVDVGLRWWLPTLGMLGWQAGVRLPAQHHTQACPALGCVPP